MTETRSMQLVRRMVVAAAEYPPTQTHSRPQAQAMVSAHPRRTDCGASFLRVMNMTLLSSVLTAATRPTAKDVIINF